MGANSFFLIVYHVLFNKLYFENTQFCMKKMCIELGNYVEKMDNEVKQNKNDWM